MGRAGQRLSVSDVRTALIELFYAWVATQNKFKKTFCQIYELHIRKLKKNEVKWRKIKKNKEKSWVKNPFETNFYVKVSVFL